MSIFAYSSDLSGFGAVVVFSLLAAQLIVWIIEIRAAGFRTWMRDSIRHSYVGYIRRYRRHEWKLFAGIFGAVFVTFTLIWRLRV
ncbi:MAG TPA: hypothetical protein VK581_12450 [Chthoniobacterales bacterium]|nr:hypothetical protein [Chthoniobacterales bacterium]